MHGKITAAIQLSEKIILLQKARILVMHPIPLKKGKPDTMRGLVEGDNKGMEMMKGTLAETGCVLCHDLHALYGRSGTLVDR